MLVKQFVDEGLGNSSYLIASEETGLAAVLDPQRDVDRYLQVAEGLRLAYALGTHLHNDFVSGSRELVAQAGVQIGASAEAKLGYEHLPLRDGDLRGHLEGGIPAWEAAGLPLARAPRMPVEELARRLGRVDAPVVIDVRFDSEWRAGHIPGAVHVEAGRLPAEDLPMAKDDLAVVHCGHADRTTVGISLLERRGYRNLALLEGGMSAWNSAGYPTEKEA